MSEVNKDNKDNKEFEFIKEQVLPKKRKKFRKWLMPFLMTIFMAVVFGVVAALTFCITEPRLYDLLHKDQQNPFVVPSPSPAEKNNPINVQADPNNEDDNPKVDPNKRVDEEDNIDTKDNPEVEDVSPDDQNSLVIQNPVKVEIIDADIDDYLTIYNDIKNLYNETGKSILTVSSIIEGKDWFENPIEKRIDTSGIVVENNGTNIMILVNFDRVKDASLIKVAINETTSVDGLLHDYESDINLAIISVKISDIPAKLLGKITVASLGESYALSVGSPIIAMGNPNGYTSSMDMGIITSKGSVVSITDHELDLFNTNMEFNKDSDGVVVNFRGEVIGVITRTLKKELNKDLSTVLGISKVKYYIDKMVKQKSRMYCGVTAENLSQEAMTVYNVPRGIYVYEVKKDSPAFNAGLKSGDIILDVGDRMITNMNSFYSSISEHEPGSPVTFKIKRTSVNTDKDMELIVVLEAKN